MSQTHDTSHCLCTECVRYLFQVLQKRIADAERRKILGVRELQKGLNAGVITDEFISFEMNCPIYDEDRIQLAELAKQSIPIYSTEKLHQKRNGGMRSIGYIKFDF